MNELDMRPRGIASGALVEIESVAKDGRRRLVRKFVARPYDIPSGSVAAYYPEANPLLPPFMPSEGCTNRNVQRMCLPSDAVRLATTLPV